MTTPSREVIERDIKRYGQHVIGVSAPTPFYYTVGMIGAGYPELLMFSDKPPVAAMMLLHQAAVALRSTNYKRHRNPVLHVGNAEIRTRRARSPETWSKYVTMPRLYYALKKREHPVLQLLLPGQTSLV